MWPGTREHQRVVPRRGEVLVSTLAEGVRDIDCKQDCEPRARFPVFALSGVPRPCPGSGEAMQVMYPRCAALDLGKDVLAAAVRVQGDGSVTLAGVTDGSSNTSMR